MYERATIRPRRVIGFGLSLCSVVSIVAAVGVTIGSGVEALIFIDSSIILTPTQLQKRGSGLFPVFINPI